MTIYFFDDDKFFDSKKFFCHQKILLLSKKFFAIKNFRRHQKMSAPSKNYDPIKKFRCLLNKLLFILLVCSSPLFESPPLPFYSVFVSSPHQAPPACKNFDFPFWYLLWQLDFFNIFIFVFHFLTKQVFVFNFQCQGGRDVPLQTQLPPLGSF